MSSLFLSFHTLLPSFCILWSCHVIQHTSRGKECWLILNEKLKSVSPTFVQFLLATRRQWILNRITTILVFDTSFSILQSYLHRMMWAIEQSAVLWLGLLQGMLGIILLFYVLTLYVVYRSLQHRSPWHCKSVLSERDANSVRKTAKSKEHL